MIRKKSRPRRSVIEQWWMCFPIDIFFKFRAIVILFKTGNGKGFVSGKYVQFYDSWLYFSNQQPLLVSLFPMMVDDNLSIVTAIWFPVDIRNAFGIALHQ